MQDFHLWQLYTNGKTKIVIVFSFTDEPWKIEVGSATTHQEVTILITTSNDQVNSLPITSNNKITIDTTFGEKVMMLQPPAMRVI